MSEESFDVIVIGGGPGGSTAATLLARNRRRVLVLEKEKFPRFHIGESLLPFNMDLFRELGLIEKFEKAGFLHKFGGEICAANGAGSVTFRFKNGYVPGYAQTYQVLRSEFDDLLLRHAAENGADVREEHTVQEVQFDPEGVTVCATRKDGSTAMARAQVLIDASGRDTFMGNRLRNKVVISRLKKLAIFAHYDGGYRAPGEDGGNTVLARIPGEDWFWLIPLKDNRVSVGLVSDRDRLRASGLPPDDYFLKTIENSPLVQARLNNAKRISEVHCTSDFSYQSKTFAGDRFVMVGDAAAFLDPIFSSGVFLAMKSASRAVVAIEEAFAKKNFARPSFLAYEKQLQKNFKIYFTLIYKFYEPAFLDLFLHPTDKFQIQPAVNALLGGCIEGHWGIRWRLHLFFFLIWLQKHLPLAPRLDWSKPVPNPQLYPAPPNPIQSSPAR